jgi:hypothetical protein
MLIYWLMFLLAAGFALHSPAHSVALVHGMQSSRLNFAWFAICICLTLAIGYRFEVGGDWGNYLRHLNDARFQDVYQAIKIGDPAYRLLNLLSVRLDWGISGVNVVSGLLFSIGLMAFCRGLSRPFLALAVAMPYMVTVVAMGYTRQSVALGLAMLGLVALTRTHNIRFVFWILCAAAFHKSAVLLLPIAALAATRNKYFTMMWVGVVSLGAYYLFLESSIDTLYLNYIEAQYQSEGALIRAAMNLVPACIYLLFAKRFQMPDNEAGLWRWLSIISILSFLMVTNTAATTAVDRIALYLLPLQLVVFSHLPDVLGRRGLRNTALTGLVLLFYGVVLFVWLNYATHAFAWLPYRFYPLEAWL